MAGASDRASAGSHSWAVAGTAWVEVDGETRECRSVCVFSPLGVETWLSVDKETGELVAAEQIDGEWIDVDIEWAREEFRDVLYAVG